MVDHWQVKEEDAGRMKQRGNGKLLLCAWYCGSIEEEGYLMEGERAWSRQRDGPRGSTKEEVHGC